MALPTVALIKTRLELLLTNFGGLSVLTGEEALITSTLPAVEVRVYGATRRTSSATRRMVTREFHIWLFYSTIDAPEAEGTTYAAYEPIYPLLETIPDYFADRPRLGLTTGDAGLDGVHSTGMMDDLGPQTYSYKIQKYVVAVFRLPVTYLRP